MLPNTVVFLDPDNGFETRTRKGRKWVRHDEVRVILRGLPEDSAVVVYQHRPHVSWQTLFDELGARLDYAPTAVAAYEGTLVFVTLAAAPETGSGVASAIQAYAARHQVVQWMELSRAAAGNPTACGIVSPHDERR